MAPSRDRARRPAAAIARKPRSDLFTATPGRTPGLLKRDLASVNNDTMMTKHHAASAAPSSTLLLANKENFITSIAEGRKQSRRPATKMYSGVSPSKMHSNSTSRTSSSDMATSTVASAPFSRQDSLNGSFEPPRKRTRCFSEARVPTQPVEQSSTQGNSQPISPKRQAGNIAGLLHDGTLEMNFTNPCRSPSATFKLISPKQLGPPFGPSYQAQRSLSSFTSLVNPNESPIVGSIGHAPPPQPVVRTVASQSDGRSTHCSTCQQAYTMEPNSLESHGAQPPVYPAPMTYPPSKPRNPILGEHLDHKPQNADGRTRQETTSYPPIHMQPTRSYPHPQVEESLTKRLSQPAPKNNTGPATYPSFVPQSTHSLTSTDRMSTQTFPPTMNTGVEQIQAPSTHERARQAYLPPSQSEANMTSHLNGAYRASSSTGTSNSTSEAESETASTSKTTPPSDADSLSNETQVEGARDGLSLYPHPIRTPQILKDQEGGVLRTLSERSYLDIPSELSQGTMNPASDYVEDNTFVEKVLAHIDHQRQSKEQTFGRRQAARIHQVLSIARPPNNTEALFLSGKEAARYLEPNRFFSGIIVTQGQQPRPLQSTTAFLNEFYDGSAKVSIQDPSVQVSEEEPAAPQTVTIRKLKERFFTNHKLRRKNEPWNCLELATHVEDGLRPPFLASEDCSLLTKLKLPSSKDRAGRRGYEPGWKEVEKWALLAQAGALTEPHQDSHGYNTYITVNHGVIGFGWLANPNAEGRAQWCDNPHAFTGGQWRYVVLRPGHTVYFPSGTVHFVFRLAAMGDTLAFGGHVLRCSQIVRWIKTLMEEKADPDVTNEDLTVSAPAYLDRVERFVREALKDGRMDIWGGKENIEEFLSLKKQFEGKKKG